MAIHGHFDHPGREYGHRIALVLNDLPSMKATLASPHRSPRSKTRANRPPVRLRVRMVIPGTPVSGPSGTGARSLRSVSFRRTLVLNTWKPGISQCAKGPRRPEAMATMSPRILRDAAARPSTRRPSRFPSRPSLARSEARVARSPRDTVTGNTGGAVPISRIRKDPPYPRGIPRFPGTCPDSLFLVDSRQRGNPPEAMWFALEAQVRPA